MPTIKMTDVVVQRLKAEARQRVDYFDAAYPGLALRVTGASDQRLARRAWTLFYRFGGKQRRLTFEPGYPSLSLADARAASTVAKLQIQKGIDPGLVKAETKAAVAKPATTVAGVVDLYIKRSLQAKGRAPRYIQETRRNFDNHVINRWADRDIKSITRQDAIVLLDDVMDKGSTVRGEDGKKKTVKGGPIAANRTKSALSAMFNFALRRGIIDVTPMALVEQPGEEQKRKRVLSAEEIKVVWQTAGTLGDPFGPYFRMAMLTGQRRQEVSRMQWAHIDLDKRLWVLPDSETKNGQAHLVPLSPLAISILNGMPHKSTTLKGQTKPSPWVFTTSGDTPVSGFSKARSRLDAGVDKAQETAELAPLPSWTIHDLRRTAATEMRRLGIIRFVVERILNHADASVTGEHYDRYDNLKEKREALNAWAAFIENLTKPPPENVVPLRQVAVEAAE